MRTPDLGLSLMYLQIIYQSEYLKKRMGISKEKLCFNLEVEMVTDLCNLCYWYPSNGLRDSNKIKSTCSYYIQLLHWKLREIQMTKKHKVKQIEFIHLLLCGVQDCNSPYFHRSHRH